MTASSNLFRAIIWATICGWLFWYEFPAPAVLTGTGVVILSNLFIDWRATRRTPANIGTSLS